MKNQSFYSDDFSRVNIVELLTTVPARAKKQENIDAFKTLLYNKAKAVHIARFPSNGFLFQTCDDLEETYKS